MPNRTMRCLSGYTLIAFDLVVAAYVLTAMRMIGAVGGASSMGDVLFLLLLLSAAATLTLALLIGPRTRTYSMLVIITSTVPGLLLAVMLFWFDVIV